MSQEEQERIIIPDENGEEHLFDILFTFDVEESDRSYMVVSPVEGSEDQEDDEEAQEVFGFRYEDKEGEFNLFEIDTEEEWDLVEEMFNTFVEDNSL